MIHNCCTSYFMNEDKFECFILKKTNDVDPPSWDFPDENGMKVIDQIVKDEDHGPSKEWGAYGW